jgi:hypothetical protein
MSGSSLKKIRKLVAKQTSRIIGSESILVYKELQAQSFWFRVQFAVRLIFKRLLVKKTVEIPE